MEHWRHLVAKIRGYETIILDDWGFFHTSNKWISQPTWVLLPTMSIPLWPQLTIFCHVRSSLTGFWKRRTSPLFSKRPPKSPVLSPVHLLRCGGAGDARHRCAPATFAATVWCCHANLDQNLWGSFPTPRWKACNEKVWRQKGDHPFTGTVDLIKCPLSVYFVSAVARRGKLHRKRVNAVHCFYLFDYELFR